MRAKLITIFFMTFTVFVGILIWKIDDVIFNDKASMNEAQTRTQMSAVTRTLETEIRSLNDVIRLSLPFMNQDRREYSAQAPLDRIEMIAKLTAPSEKNGRKEWQVTSSFFQENSPNRAWAPQYIYLALKTVKEQNLDNKKTILLSLLDPKRTPHILLLSPSGVQGEYFAGLVGAEVFQGLIDRMKGQTSSVFIVNQNGQTLGHTVPEYVGKLLTEDPLVAGLIANGDSSRFGKHKDLRGEDIQGLYEQVNNSNVYAVITTPTKTLVANRDSLRMQFVMMGLGLALVGLGIFVFVYRPEREVITLGVPSGPQVVTPQVAANTASAASKATAPQNNNPVTPANRMEAYTKVASSLSHEMRGPLTSILGHVQLLRAQGEGAAISNDHLEKIEREARIAREIVTKLQAFAGEGISKTTKTSLDLVALKALKAVDGKILNKGIKLNKSILTTTELEMASDLVVKAVENLLLNAIEAMERAPKKELEVVVKDENGLVVLEVKDSGEGIAPQDLSKIFDPFFTTKSSTNHVGLGLATSFGIFKEFHGEVTVTSEKSVGTTIRVVFTPQAAVAETLPASEQKPAKSVMTAPAKSEPEVVAAPVVETKSEIKAPAAPAPKATVSPLLVDNLIEKMIDDEDEDMPQFPPAPRPDFEEDVPPPPVMAAPPAPKKDFSAKIDKPKIDLKKRLDKFNEVEVSIRRPGEKV